MRLRRRYRMKRASDGCFHRVRRYTGFEVYTIWWTQACSGCTETREGHHSPRRGAGCSECGYTGKSRLSWYVPFNPANQARIDAKADARSSDAS